MNIIKILAPVVVILITFVQYFLDNKYNKQRSKKYRIIRILLLNVTIAALVFSSVSIYLDDINSDELKNQMSSLKQDYERSDSTAYLKEENAKLEINNLFERIEDLSSKLAPFLDFAITEYPNLKPHEALGQLHNEIIETLKYTPPFKEFTDQVEDRRIYKPLNKSLRDRMIRSLIRIISLYPDIHLIIYVENGNPLRKSIADEIVGILYLSGMTNFEIKTCSSFFSHGTGSNWIIKGRKADANVARIFFQPFIDYYFVPIPSESFNWHGINKNTLILHIFGDPFFEKNGKINFFTLTSHSSRNIIPLQRSTPSPNTINP